MDRGWVKLWRKTMESAIWTFPEGHFKMAMTCLLMANHKPKKWFDKIEKKEVAVESGQFITSLNNLSEICGVGKQVVRTSLSNLEKCDFLTQQITQHFRMISIVNWDTYQGDIDTINTEGNTPLTHHQHTANTPLTPTKECKNDKNDKKEEKTPVRSAKAKRTPVQTQEEYFAGVKIYFDSISPEQIAEWGGVYPAVDIKLETGWAREWLFSNPSKRKKLFRRYLTGWFGRSQERGGTRKGDRYAESKKQAGTNRPDKYPGPDIKVEVG